MAQDLGLPVLPISIEGTRHVLPKGSALVTPGNITITIHPPLPAPDTEGALDELMARSRAAIESSLEQTDVSPGWPDARA